MEMVYRLKIVTRAAALRWGLCPSLMSTLREFSFDSARNRCNPWISSVRKLRSPSSPWSPSPSPSPSPPSKSPTPRGPVEFSLMLPRKDSEISSGRLQRGLSLRLIFFRVFVTFRPFDRTWSHRNLKQMVKYLRDDRVRYSLPSITSS
jgi:hypothetical protein